MINELKEKIMVELKPITEDYFLDAFNLKLAPGQEDEIEMALYLK